MLAASGQRTTAYLPRVRFIHGALRNLADMFVCVRSANSKSWDIICMENIYAWNISELITRVRSLYIPTESNSSVERLCEPYSEHMTAESCFKLTLSPLCSFLLLVFRFRFRFWFTFALPGNFGKLCSVVERPSGPKGMLENRAGSVLFTAALRRIRGNGIYSTSNYLLISVKWSVVTSRSVSPSSEWVLCIYTVSGERPQSSMLCCYRSPERTNPLESFPFFTCFTFLPVEGGRERRTSRVFAGEV